MELLENYLENVFAFLSMQWRKRENANMSEKKAVIKNADMPDDMQQDAVEFAIQAMEKFNIEKDIAAHVKKVN